MRVSSQHVHSAFSHDGKLSVAQLADFCGQFIPLLPRIEYTCQPQGMHILGVGALAYHGAEQPGTDRPVEPRARRLGGAGASPAPGLGVRAGSAARSGR